MNGLSQRTVCMPLIRICLFKRAQLVLYMRGLTAPTARASRAEYIVLPVGRYPVVLPPVRPRTPL